MTVGWSLVLHGTAVIGDDEAPSGTTAVACMPAPPDGMGVPPLRIEDVTYPQRDGVTHFSDWYGPRLITAAQAVVCPDDCESCPSAREKAALLLGAWSRHCDDDELVIFTDCHDDNPAVTGAARTFIGPYGAIGRPRVATFRWLPGGSHCGVATLRFDAVDHRLYLLDASGTPGSGAQCLDLDPVIAARCRTYPRCYTTETPGVTGNSMCYDVDNPSVTGVVPLLTDNYGTLCAPYEIVLTGPLTNPRVENITTGESITYTGIIGSGQTITINTATGTAYDQDGIPRTYLLTGDTRAQVEVGVNVFRLVSGGSGDTGTASVCYRPAVLTG